MTDIPLRCRCGRVQGTAHRISPASGKHVVCYCDDCRAFLHFLERDDLLDAHGGTDIVQTTPSQVHFDAGVAELRAMRLSEKGMLRWYSACCHTPLGNTVDATLPFVGVPLALFETGLAALTALAARGESPDAILGVPVRVQGRFAYGGSAPGAHARAPLGFMLGFVPFLVRGFVRGLAQPSPYFDAATKAPLVAPRVLGTDERAALLARARRAPA